jgi:formate/nitrite transporter FocA (FNT family)
LGRNTEVLRKVLEIDPDINLDRLNIMGFLGNLLPVTLGNIIGGALMVATVYWLIIVLPRRIKEVSKKR